MTSKGSYTLISAFIFSSIVFIAWYYVYGQASAEAPRLATVNQETGLSNYVTHPFIKAFLQHESAVLIDIRTREEYLAGHIPGAINIDYYDPLFTQAVQRAVNDKVLFMYCRSGNRTNDVLGRLTNLGIEVYEMRGGILSYEGQLVQD